MTTCIICEQQLRGPWTDLHGEIACSTCGTPYLILLYDEERNRIPDALPECTIADPYIPVLKAYWNEARRHMGLGVFMLGVSHNMEGRRAFDEWCDAHPELLPEKQP